MRHVSPVLATDFKSSFLSCEKDQEEIWRKLFVVNKPYSDYLKRLLIVNTPDCLDMENEAYSDRVNQYDLHRLKEEEYLRVVPKFELKEHEKMRSYILLEFDDYLPTTNPEFRNCIVSITILTHFDQWEMDDYKLRPHQIAGYIDGILNNCKLSGIGTLQFMGAQQITLNEYLGGIILRYVATHGSDDRGNIVAED